MSREVNIVRWSLPAEGADGIAMDGELVVVAGREVLTAYEVGDGSLSWETVIPNPSGWASVVISEDTQQVSVGLRRLDTIVVDRRSGRLIETAPPVAMPGQRSLPPGYTIEGTTLGYAGSSILDLQKSRPGAMPPRVRRVDPYTVVNALFTGLTVLTDDGVIVADVRLDPAERFTPSELAGSGRLVAGVATDGHLYLLDLDRL